MLFKLAWLSLLNRKVSVLLTIASISLSVIIVVGVEHIRSQAEQSFNRTVSGVDLIIGARTSQLNLLLYSVFRIGNPSNNISWESYQLIASDDRVAWTIPISLGDSHRGYRVLGTTTDYLEHFRYGNQRALALQSGFVLSDTYDAVLGAEVARQLNYAVGDHITLAHGLGQISFHNHTQHPFTISGILEPTGTPVDQTIHTLLTGMEAIHMNRPPGAPPVTADQLQPTSITAFMVGLETRMTVFNLQRAINDYRGEPLLAILPGVAMAELWEMMSTVENILALISALVLVASLLGLATMLLSSMRERRGEIFLFRSIGMHASSVLLLVELEAILITAVAATLGIALVTAVLLVSQDWLSQNYGVFVSAIPLSAAVAKYIAAILASAMVLALIPALTAYRSALGSKIQS
jgi:putative ABC transport system permease protein